MKTKEFVINGSLGSDKSWKIAIPLEIFEESRKWDDSAFKEEDSWKMAELFQVLAIAMDALSSNIVIEYNCYAGRYVPDEVKKYSRYCQSRAMELLKPAVSSLKEMWEALSNAHVYLTHCISLRSGEVKVNTLRPFQSKAIFKGVLEEEWEDVDFD